MPAIQKTDNFYEVGSSPREGYPRFGKAARQKLSDEETGQLLSLTALSLSAFNVNNCRFVVVKDPDLRKQINKFSLNPTQVPHQASLIILCADLTPKDSQPAAGGEEGPGGKLEAATPQRKATQGDHCQLLRDEALCSCGIAAQTLMLTARAMGYDSWRLDAFDNRGISRLINLPEGFLVAMILVVGKHMKQSWQQVNSCNFHDVVILDQF